MAIKNYITGQANEITKRNQKSSNQMNEQLILNSLKLCKAARRSDHQQMLKLIDDLALQDTLPYLRIYLLEQTGDYLQSFRLNMAADGKDRIF